MSTHLPRFLNLPSTSDPFALLGLAPQQCTPAKVEEALRLRIARTYNHPDGRSDEAEQVRQTLRDAAAKLKDPVQRERLARSYRSPHIRPMLTPFDREALAILVGSGGWNAVSRARLVSLAQHQGIAPQGLMKVISGLSRYARQGGGHLEAADITGGRQRFHVQHGPTALDSLRAVSDSIIEKYTPELREESAWATIKLSIVFGMLAILLAIYFVRVLLPEPQPPIPRVVVDPALVPAEVRSGDRDRRRDESPETRDREVRVVAFDRLPTFELELPEAVSRHAAACAKVPGELEEISRRLSITDQPSDAVYRMWEAAITDVSRGWPLVEDDLLERITDGIHDVLFLAADSPSVSERLLEHLRPPHARRTASGDEDWFALIAGPWQVKQLARIVQRPDLPPILGDQARTLFSAAGGDDQAASIDRDRPERCAAAWLDDTVPSRIDRLAHADDVLLHWELWLTAQRALDDGADFERSILSAINHLVASTAGLRPDDPGLSLLGRLVTELDLSRSAATRRAILAMFEDDRLNVNRLATFSAILAVHPDAPWMDASLVLPLDADDIMRRRVHQDIEKAWPEVKADDADRPRRLVAMDTNAAKLWRELQEAMLREPVATDQLEQMRQLHAAVRLNQAAALLASTDAELVRQGGRILDQLQEQSTQPHGFRSGSSSSQSPTNTNPRGRGSGVPAGGVQGGLTPDGMWAAAYESARRSPAERMKELRALRNMGGDLGPTDAAVFVREVYRATLIDVREEAQTILTAQFPRGVTVGMYMLDLFHEAPRTELTGNLIVRYTGRPLPDVRSESWRREARAALLEHVIALRGADELKIDQLASELSDAALSEAGAIDPSQRAVRNARTPTNAANGRYRAWRDLARGQLPNSIPAPGDLMTLDRRHRNRLHFAESPIQAYIALTISTLELVTYLASMEQPALDETLHELLRHASEQRLNAEELLAQAVFAERAIAEVWRLRIGDRRDGQSPDARAMRRSGHDGSSSLRPAPMRDQAAFDFLASRLALHTIGKLATGTAHRPITRQGNDRWRVPLEALNPRTPQSYFTLAEDIADMATTDRERDLARHLFLLAGVLAPERFGRSASLALAQLKEHRPTRRRLRALADLLDPFAGAVLLDRDPAMIGDETREMPAVLELGEAFSALRLGRGSRAQTILRRHAVEELLDRVAHAPSIDPVRLREDARSGGRRPAEAVSPRMDAKLLVELALLAGAARPWSADLALYERSPLIEVDEDLLQRMLGRDAARPYYRDGRWVSRP